MRIVNGACNWILGMIHRRMYRKHDGILMSYVIYQPHNPKPNVVTHVHPLLKDDEKLKELYQQVADRIREFYPIEVKERDTACN